LIQDCEGGLPPFKRKPSSRASDVSRIGALCVGAIKQERLQGEKTVNTPLVLVRRMASVNSNILWLRELVNMELSYDLRIDSEYDEILAQGCEVTFSAFGVSGVLQGKEVDVYFKRLIGDDRTSGDAVVMEQEPAWIDIFVDDYALGFVAMMHEKALLSNKPLGLWFKGERDFYRWSVRHDLLEYKRPNES
jgi:hypothetical protein